MTDEKIKEEFEKWLRSYCFQAPPEESYQLMKDTWKECFRTAERLAKIEVLEEVLNADKAMTTYQAVTLKLKELKAGS